MSLDQSPIDENESTDGLHRREPQTLKFGRRSFLSILAVIGLPILVCSSLDGLRQGRVNFLTDASKVEASDLEQEALRRIMDFDAAMVKRITGEYNTRESNFYRIPILGISPEYHLVTPLAVISDAINPKTGVRSSLRGVLESISLNGAGFAINLDNIDGNFTYSDLNLKSAVNISNLSVTKGGFDERKFWANRVKYLGAKITDELINSDDSLTVSMQLSGQPSMYGQSVGDHTPIFSESGYPSSLRNFAIGSVISNARGTEAYQSYIEAVAVGEDIEIPEELNNVIEESRVQVTDIFNAFERMANPTWVDIEITSSRGYNTIAEQFEPAASTNVSFSVTIKSGETISMSMLQNTIPTEDRIATGSFSISYFEEG